MQQGRPPGSFTSLCSFWPSFRLFLGALAIHQAILILKSALLSSRVLLLFKDF